LDLIADDPEYDEIRKKAREIRANRKPHKPRRKKGEIRNV